MPTNAAQIATIKPKRWPCSLRITANPKPTYDIDGQKFSWGQYLKQLQDTVLWCDQQAAASAPVEVRTQGYT